MENNKQLNTALIFIALFLFLLPRTYAQVGVFNFKSPDAQYNNIRVVNIVEAPNQEIYMLGKASNEKFQSLKPYFARLDKKGNLLFNKTIEAANLYDLNKIVILPGQDINLYGNVKIDNKYTPYINTINASAKSKNLDSKFAVYSTMLNDVEYMDDKNIIIVESKYGKADLLNISVYMVNLQTKEQVWYKNIASENNEEANQLIILKDKTMVVLGKKYNDEMTNYVPIVYKLTSNGDVSWKKGLSVPGNFFNQSIASDDAGVLYYICGYSRETTGTCETRLITFNQENDNIANKIFQEISANGILSLTNGNFIIYGSNLMVQENRVITKAKYLIFNSTFEILGQGQLGPDDQPDVTIIKTAPKSMPTSSDLTTAYQLSDGRIALSGRIYMPNSKDLSKTDNDRQNNALLILMSADGKYK